MPMFPSEASTRHNIARGEMVENTCCVMDETNGGQISGFCRYRFPDAKVSPSYSYTYVL